MAVIILGLIIIIFLTHVYYHDLSTPKENKSTAFFSLGRRYFSFNYALPLSFNENDSKEIVKYKKISNNLLYIFYGLLTLAFIYILVTD